MNLFLNFLDVGLVKKRLSHDTIFTHHESAKWYKKPFVTEMGVGTKGAPPLSLFSCPCGRTERTEKNRNSLERDYHMTW